jgi:conjugal transfer mating pair stabilization protein TraG
MKAGVTDRIEGDDSASNALARHRAAILLAADEHAKPEDRVSASKYLLDSANAMIAARFAAGDRNPRPRYDIASPTNRSGVNANALIRQATSKRTSSGNSAQSQVNEPSVSQRLDEGYKLAADVVHGTESIANSVLVDRKAGEQAAADAGLTGAEGPGTNRRVAANIGANLTGDKSHTELPIRR